VGQRTSSQWKTYLDFGSLKFCPWNSSRPYTHTHTHTHTKAQMQRKRTQCLPITLSLGLTTLLFCLHMFWRAFTDRIRRCHQKIVIQSIIPSVGSAMFTFATKASDSTSRKEHHLVHKPIAIPPLSVSVSSVFSRLFNSTTCVFSEIEKSQLFFKGRVHHSNKSRVRGSETLLTATVARLK
jgi:hypothetical protein